MEAGHHLRIRPARLHDLEALVEFSAAMARETEGRTLDRGRLREGTAAVLNKPERGFYLVAETQDGQRRSLIGQLLITFEWSDWRNATFWWIQSVYVAEPWRRQGVYRRMHQAVLEQARSRPDVCGIRLYVEQENAVAQAVYRKVGLRKTPYLVFEEDFVLGRRGRQAALAPRDRGRRPGA